MNPTLDTLTHHAYDIMRAASFVATEKPRLSPRGQVKQMRALAKQLLAGEVQLKEIDLLDIHLPHTLARLQLRPLLQPELGELWDFGCPPDYFSHYFILGDEILAVTCQESLQDHYIEYLFNVYVENDLYLRDYVGQEPLDKAVSRITTPLRDELLEVMQYDETEEDYD